ncbi:MAG: protein kinase [Gemmatimonadetes bacterium]|nr:protein kinase [Gemmatimonadota bacterium]
MNDYLRDRVTVAVGDQYLVEHEIGRGGMAVVYRAMDLRLHRPVAIKVLPPDLAFNGDVRTRFIREAQTAAQLNHPNIVPIYSVDDSDGGALTYFVMAFVDGESLGVRLAREGAWPVDKTVRVLRDVADALAYAHARGVVHRDIKPDNILIDRASGRPLVTDFGIARAAAGETRLTVTGVAVGTPAYMSPEQALGEREIDGRSDLYSLAVVGYHMLAGDTPFKAGNTPAMLVKHVSERPRPIRERRPETPAYLAVAIDRALAKRPEDRWSDAAEFRDAIDGAQQSSRNRRSEPPSPPPAVRPVIHPIQPIQPMPPLPALGVERYAQPASSPAPFPAPPPGLSRKELKRWYRAQRRWGAEQMVIGLRIPHGYDERPIEDRVIAFRRSVVTFAVITPMLLAINAGIGGAPWFFFPAGIMFLSMLRKGGSIWSDGIGPLEAFSKGIRTKLRAQRGAAPLGSGAQPAPPLVLQASRSPEQLAGELAAREILAGPHGEAVRRAAADRAMMRDIVAALRPVEREMIPDIEPTVNALTERVGALATTLHRLDADVSGATLGALDGRIASLGTEPDTAERERRMSLLQRQRSSLHDLLERRRSLANQLESAGLMLQNLKLDLLKLRSSGIGSAIEDVTSATQEARALSRDIGNLVEASEELKKL